MINYSQVCLQMQSDLNSLYEWCVRNGMQINVEKSWILTISKVKNDFVVEYPINDKILEKIKEIEVLNVRSF